jgi:hypothetical protein
VHQKACLGSWIVRGGDFAPSDDSPGHLDITVSPYHMARHNVIMITRTLKYVTRKEDESRTRITGIEIKVLNHEDTKVSP